MRLITLLILVLLIESPLYSITDLEFERLNSNHGLSTEEVRNIFQDSEGFMWFLTKEGLNRYDGYEFEIYKQGKSKLDLSSSAFESICQDAEGRLWLGTLDKGIVIYNKKANSVTRFFELAGDSGLMDMQIRSLLCDKNGLIWIGTEYGLYTYQPDSNELIFHNLGNPDSDVAAWCIVEDIMEDRGGNIWIATWSEGLQMYDQRRKLFVQYRNFNSNSYTQHESQIKSLFQDQLGYIWVGTWEDGLYMCKMENGRLNPERTFLYDNDNPQSISGNIIYSINQDYNNNLWVGTPYGLSIIEGIYSQKPHISRIVYTYGTEKGLCNNEVWKIFRDNSGLMWLGTLEGGVNKVHPGGRIFDSYPIPPVSDQIQSQTTQSFCTDPLGNFLVGVKSLGFGIYDLEKRTYTPYTEIWPYSELPHEINTVKCFLSQGEELWLGTRYLGLIIFNTRTNTYTSLYEENSILTSFEINTIVPGGDGQVWVGTEDGLFLVHRNGEVYEVEKTMGIGGNRIKSIILDKDGCIWIGTEESGITKIPFNGDGKDQIKKYNQGLENLVSNHIQCIFQDSKGKLWAGSNDFGLLKYNPESDAFEKARVLINSKTDAIMSIIEDADGNLWLTTNGGIVRIYYQGGIQKSDSYTISDGLQGNIFLPNSIYQLNANRIFAGGYYGFNAFYPSSVRVNNHIPTTVITGFSVNNSPLNPANYKTSALNLKHKQNNIEIRFSALSYLKSEKNVFAYKLEDVSSEWTYIDASQRAVNFSNLGAGSYRFLLKSANSSEVWNEIPEVIEFNILPSPFLTWWAFSIYSVLFTIMLVGLFDFLMKNERIKRAYELEKIEHAKDEKLNQFKLKFFTNISHEILTPLSIMYCSIDLLKTRTRKGKKELLILERNILQLKRLLNQLLDFRKMESGHLKLKVKRDNLTTFVKTILDSFEPLVLQRQLEIRFKPHGTAEMGYFDEDKLNKVLHNLVSNSVKYTPAGGIILVELKSEKRQDGRWVSIKVSDTGVGIPREGLDHVFERFYRAEIDKEETGTGIGLSLTKSLIELHHGNINVKSEVGKGTVFTIEFPVYQAAFTPEELIPVNVNLVEKADFPERDEDEQTLTVNQASGRLRLLLAEDNPDFRHILKSYLEKKYDIIEASNGSRALGRAIQLKPDLIISDVMMPGLNGFELCTRLKNNVETKLIPVILLTAKTDDTDKAEGYSSGADSYITKPVSLPLLNSRITALLLKKANLESYSEEHLILPETQQKINNEQFIRMLKKTMELHMSDSEFQVTDMHIQFGMSSSMFYRRVKELTRLAPVEYVRHFRLNRAASMLKKGNNSIAEVAYGCGFSDQSYFGVCFKKQFGMTPSAFCRQSVKKNRASIDY